MKEWRHRIHGPVVTTCIRFEDSIAQETEAGACLSCYWPNTIYAAFTAVRNTLKQFAETRDMTKVDAKFDEDELLKLLPSKSITIRWTSTTGKRCIWAVEKVGYRLH